MGKTLQEVQAGTTSTEFVQWRKYLEDEEAKQTTTHHYLANIAAEVCRSRLKNPGKVRLEDFLMKRVRVDEVVRKPAMHWKQRQAQSRAFWCAVAGIKRTKR